MFECLVLPEASFIATVPTWGRGGSPAGTLDDVAMRNQKLKQIDEDFQKGVRYGQRIGPTPKDSIHLHKPDLPCRKNKFN